LRALLALLDALVFSGLWVSLAAPALVAAASRVFGDEPHPLALAYAFAGTFAIYGLDRLRDRESDVASAPIRSAFVARHRGALLYATIAAGLVAAACALALGWRGLALSAVAGGVGALHRKLKRVFPLKPLYIAAIWLLVVLGSASLTAHPPASALAWSAAILGAALYANAIAFTARDREGIVARVGRTQAMAAAVFWATLGSLAAFTAAPRALAPLGAVPIATLLTLVRFRWDERYAPFVVDGALIAGAVVAYWAS
jgi:4-hydroxybenzoate polyprenyltransferase